MFQQLQPFLVPALVLAVLLFAGRYAWWRWRRRVRTEQLAHRLVEETETQPKKPASILGID